jgi:hypothetical protein
MAGGFGIGLINMQVRGDDITDANNYTVVRLRRNVSRGSDVGVLFMQRQSTENADNYNRVAGIDANIRFLGRLDWNSYFIGTRTPGRSEGQYSARTSLNWEGNFFHGKGGVMSLGENFNNDLGFYRRTGVKKWFADIGVRPRPEALRKRGIRELHPHIVWDLFTDQGNHMVQKRLHSGQTFFFENGAVVELSYNPAFNLLDRPLRLSPKADPLPAGPYSWQEWGILANTDQSRRVSLSSRLAWGELYNGTQQTPPSPCAPTTACASPQACSARRGTSTWRRARSSTASGRPAPTTRSPRTCSSTRCRNTTPHPNSSTPTYAST